MIVLHIHNNGVSTYIDTCPSIEANKSLVLLYGKKKIRLGNNDIITFFHQQTGKILFCMDFKAGTFFVGDKNRSQ